MPSSHGSGIWQRRASQPLVVDSFVGRGSESIFSGVQRSTWPARSSTCTGRPSSSTRILTSMGRSWSSWGSLSEGRAALWSAYARFQEAYTGRPPQGHLAFYLSTCFIELEAEHEVTGGPIRIFHGTADDWTRIDQCRAMVDRMRAGGVDADLFAYPDAQHSFDNAGLAWGEIHVSLRNPSPRNCVFVERDGMIVGAETGDKAGVASPCVEHGVSYGCDADSRDAAERDLIGLLRTLLLDP